MSQNSNNSSDPQKVKGKVATKSPSGRGRGRPKIDPDKVKEVVTFRASPEDQSIIRKAAVLRGRSPAAWIRDVIVATSAKVIQAQAKPKSE